MRRMEIDNAATPRQRELGKSWYKMSSEFDIYLQKFFSGFLDELGNLKQNNFYTSLRLRSLNEEDGNW